jgi:site-specific DNA-adenine methylase
MGWTLVEPCCGTSALTMAVLGGRQQLVPRQGSKWSMRKQLLPMFPQGRPSRILLSDASPWAVAVQTILTEDRARLLRELYSVVNQGSNNPRDLYERLNGQPVPEDPVQMTIQLLWLQRMAFTGKAVRVVDGRWSSPGLNGTSAFGVAATPLFGEIKPLGPALLRTVQAAPTHDCVKGIVGLVEPQELEPEGWIYLDPPYARQTGYGPDDLTRSQVVEMARAWRSKGTRVIVSEAEPIQELGWPSRSLELETHQGKKHRRFGSKTRSEYITYNTYKA